MPPVPAAACSSAPTTRSPRCTTAPAPDSTVKVRIPAHQMASGLTGSRPMSSTYAEVGAQDPADRLGEGVVGSVAADQHAKGLEGEPGDVLAVLDGGPAEGLEQEGLAGSGRPANRLGLGHNPSHGGASDG